VRAIVLEHGGEIALGNRKGGGLRVTVSLPVVNG
jgi:signal transduction histidine kinase